MAHDIARYTGSATHSCSYRTAGKGNYGATAAVGDGVGELRLFFGPGYRVYFGEDEDTVVVLLCGGDKSTQQRDIVQAKGDWKEYSSRA